MQMKKEKHAPIGKKIRLIYFFLYFIFLSIAIILLKTEILPGDEFWGMIIFVHGILLIILILKIFHAPQKVKVTKDAIYFDEKEYNYEQQSFFPMGYTYHASRTYSENWYIVARDNDTKHIEEISFKCNQNTFRHMAFSLMDKTLNETLPPIELTYDPEKEMTLFNYISGVCLWAILPPFLFHLLLFFLNGNENAELNRFFLIFNVIIAGIIAILLFFFSPYYKLKRYKQITHIYVDREAVTINGTSIRWEDIQKAKLTCGLTNKKDLRKLELTTEHGITYYEYQQPYTLNIQGTLEKWFYRQLKNRFEPFFIGKNVTYSHKLTKYRQ